MDVDSQESSSVPQFNPNSALPARPEPPPRNTKLNDFESLMDAMDAELAKKRGDAISSTAHPKPASQDATMQEAEDDDEDEDAQLDAEFMSLLKKDASDDQDETAQYGLIKNLLQSFSSQNGAAGPASNMLGVLDPTMQLPYDSEKQ